MPTLQMMANVVVFFALEREARLFRRRCPQVPVHLTQVGVERARVAVEDYLALYKPSLLILAGFGGALTLKSKVGDAIVATDVIRDDGMTWPCFPVENATGRVLTVSRMIATVEEKILLGTKYAADVCDMESTVVAELCASHGVPFLAVRAISDCATRSLSPTLDKLIVNGKVSAWQTLLAVVREPSIVRDFWRLARGTKIAAANLADRLNEILLVGDKVSSKKANP